MKCELVTVTCNLSNYAIVNVMLVNTFQTLKSVAIHGITVPQPPIRTVAY